MSENKSFMNLRSGNKSVYTVRDKSNKCRVSSTLGKYMEGDSSDYSSDGTDYSDLHDLIKTKKKDKVGGKK